mgnify:CR=1 FL=1
MKIVVPIMPASLEEAQELELSRFEGADIIEWRADFLDKDSILTVLQLFSRNSQALRLSLPSVRRVRVASLS